MVAPSWLKVRLKAACSSPCSEGVVAPRMLSTALNAPGDAAFAVVPPEPSTLRAMQRTVPESKGTRLSMGAPGAIPDRRDMILPSVARSSFRQVENMTKPPPLAPPSTAAGLYLISVKSAWLSGLRASVTGPGRYQNWLGSAWSGKTVTPSTMMVLGADNNNMGSSSQSNKIRGPG